MESIYTELALYGNKNECARTGNEFFLISEICDDTVSLGSATYTGGQTKFINYNNIPTNINK